MYDTILLPTDGSETAKTATRTALALAERFDASIHAITVVELEEFPADVESEAAHELRQRGEEMLAAIAEQAADAGIAAATHVIEATEPIHREIIDYATDHDSDLIVMGTHGRTGLDRFVLGSVAERTLRMSPIPVLTVHEDMDPEIGFEKILAPTDGSDPADIASEHGIALAAATEAALHVVHVVDMNAVSGKVGSAEILDALEEVGQQAVDDVVDRADEASLRSVEASVLSGTPARAILDYAADRDIDLIVIGTHGRTGLERYLLGSVTEKIVRLADTPVLTVSPSEDH